MLEFKRGFSWSSSWQYRVPCASLGLLASVRACSSRLSPVFRLRCRFSADTSAVLTASAASMRTEDKPTSMPALLHRNSRFTWTIGPSLPQLPLPPCLVLVLSSRPRRSGSPAPHIHFSLLLLLRKKKKKSHKMIHQLANDWPYLPSPW